MNRIELEVLFIVLLAPVAIVTVRVIVTTCVVLFMEHVTVVGHVIAVVSAGTVNITFHAVIDVTPLFFMTNGFSLYV